MASSDNLQRAIGQLEGLMESMAKTQAAQGEQSSKARAKMYDAIDEIKGLVQDIDFRLGNLEKRVADITPETEEFTQWRYRAQGAGMLGRGLWWIGGMVLSAAAGMVAAWQWFVGKG